MHWLSIAVIGIAANLDNLGIGLSFGSRSIRVPVSSNLLIAIISAFSTYLAMTIGKYLSQLITPSLGNVIGGLVIIVLGIWGLRSIYLRSIHNDTGILAKMNGIAVTSDRDANHVISWGESISLAFGLSLNCIATCLGAGASGVSPTLTAISIGLFSLLSIGIGVRFGKQMAKSWLGKYAEVIGCMFLIMIGCYEIIL